VLAVFPRFVFRVVGPVGLGALWLTGACATPASFWENEPQPGFTPAPAGFLGEPPRATTPAAVPAPAEPAAPRWLAPDDIPCSAGPQALLPALEARVMHRVRTPVGLVPLSAPARPGTRGLEVKVVMEIDRRGTIRRSVVSNSSGIGELDRAVLSAIDEAGCMPVPARALLDPGGTFKVSLGYGFTFSRS
jgi:TonB family protein